MTERTPQARWRFQRVQWDFVGRVAGRWGMVLWFVLPSLQLAIDYSGHPHRLWPDAHIYFRATEAWLAGGSPWLASWEGIRYAAPPPALLLNLPLIPFGEGPAVAFWVAANSMALVLLLRRLRLGWWWIAFYPVFEGLAAATPDIALAMLVFAGWGAVAAIAKPYSIPALLSEGRWRALGVAAAVFILTVPVLPWGQFLESRAVIEGTFSEWARPTSAWGNPLMMAGTAVALVLLGLRRGLALLTPALLAQQPHYSLFSLGAISTSTILMIALARPNPHWAAAGVMLYALWERGDLLVSLAKTVRRGPRAAALAARLPR